MTPKELSCAQCCDSKGLSEYMPVAKCSDIDPGLTRDIEMKVVEDKGRKFGEFEFKKEYKSPDSSFYGRKTMKYASTLDGGEEYKDMASRFLSIPEVNLFVADFMRNVPSKGIEELKSGLLQQFKSVCDDDNCDTSLINDVVDRMAKKSIKSGDYVDSSGKSFEISVASGDKKNTIMFEGMNRKAITSK